MDIIRDLEHCPAGAKGAVVALGNFDGLHLGHQAILRRTIEEAKKAGRKAAVMSFEPHPREFFARDHQPLRIYPLRRKLQLLKETGGIDTVFLARFNRKLASTNAQGFVEDILHRQLSVHHIVTGYNFAFGKNRQGDTAFLESITPGLGIDFTRVAPVETAQGAPVSSSAIRAFLAQGETQKAAELLGRPYSIGGRVRGGDARGRTLGFPTANLWLKTLFRPRFGIYAARIIFHKDGARHDGVASIGIRPTFSTDRPLLEVHCFDLSRMFYGEYIEVQLLEFIREEKKFERVDDLIAQMEIDAVAAKRLLKAKGA